MAALIFGNVIVLLIFGVLAFGSARTVYMGLTLPKAVRRTDEPGVCGHCGYTFGVGHTEICPECGKRFVEAGMLTRPLARRLRPPADHVLGSIGLLLVIITLVGCSLVMAVLSGSDQPDVVAIWVAAGGVVFFGGAMALCAVLVLRRRSKIFAPNWQRGGPRVEAAAAVDGVGEAESIGGA